MKLRIENFKNDNYCVLSGLNNTFITNVECLKEILNIDKNELIKILQKYGANFHNGSMSIDKELKKDEYFYFESFQNCEKFLNSSELEPYIMMLELSD